MMDEPKKFGISAADRILRSRGATPQGGDAALSNDPSTYEAVSISPGFPQMGFDLIIYSRTPDGDFVRSRSGSLVRISYGIQFHDVKRPKWHEDIDDMEAVSFTHAGEAFTIFGRGLRPMYKALMNCTLQEAEEYCADAYPSYNHDEPFIDSVMVTDVEDMVKKAREKRAGH